MKWMFKCLFLVGVLVVGYKYRYRLMNALLAIEDIRQLIVSRATDFPNESSYIYQR